MYKHVDFEIFENVDIMMHKDFHNNVKFQQIFFELRRSFLKNIDKFFQTIKNRDRFEYFKENILQLLSKTFKHSFRNFDKISKLTKYKIQMQKAVDIQNQILNNFYY